MIFVDVESPVLNVYDEPRLSAIQGEVIDFGLPEGNAMRGWWLVLSIERGTRRDGMPREARANVIRRERIVG